VRGSDHGSPADPVRAEKNGGGGEARSAEASAQAPPKSHYPEAALATGQWGQERDPCPNAATGGDGMERKGSLNSICLSTHSGSGNPSKNKRKGGGHRLCCTPRDRPSSGRMDGSACPIYSDGSQYFQSVLLLLGY
jgi:hypothetical protein